MVYQHVLLLFFMILLGDLGFLNVDSFLFDDFFF